MLFSTDLTCGSFLNMDWKRSGLCKIYDQALILVMWMSPEILLLNYNKYHCHGLCDQCTLKLKSIRAVIYFSLHYKYEKKRNLYLSSFLSNLDKYQGLLLFPVIRNLFLMMKNLPARVHPDALCLKPRLVDALRGADKQSVQWCRRSRSSGPSGRYVPGQQRQQHQQPLHGRLWWTSVTGRTVFKRLPEWPIGLKLKEKNKDRCQKCSCTTTYPKTLTLSCHFTKWRKHSRSLSNRI